MTFTRQAQQNRLIRLANHQQTLLDANKVQAGDGNPNGGKAGLRTC